MSCLFSQIVSFEFKIFTENWIVEYLGVALRLRVSANTAACASHRSLSLGRFRSCIPPGGGRGGGTHLYKPYRYVPLQRVWYLGLFGLKTSIHFAHFGLESGMVFELREHNYEIFIVSIPNE